MLSEQVNDLAGDRFNAEQPRTSFCGSPEPFYRPAPAPGRANFCVFGAIKCCHIVSVRINSWLIIRVRAVFRRQEQMNASGLYFSPAAQGLPGICLFLLFASGSACLGFDCHPADGTCNPLATALLFQDPATPCQDPDYLVPGGALAVTSPADSGPGTLRQALADVAAGGAIDLTDVGGAIILASALPAISNDIELYGACGPTQIIDGANAFRMFRITGGATVALFYLTLQNGNATGGAGDVTPGSPPAPAGGGGGAGMGGSIFIDGGASVTIEQSAFFGNSAAGGTGGFGIARAGAGNWEGKNGGAPAHDAAAGGVAVICPGATGAGGFGTGGSGGCTNTGGPSTSGGAGGYGGGGGAGGSSSGGGAPGAAGTFGGIGGAGCAGVNENAPAGGGGGGGLGGAIAVHGVGSTLSISDSSFANNNAAGGAGGTSVDCNPGAPGQGKGGAIFADAGAVVAQSNLLMTGNSATDQAAAANDNDNVFGFNFP